MDDCITEMTENVEVLDDNSIGTPIAVIGDNEVEIVEDESAFLSEVSESIETTTIVDYSEQLVMIHAQLETLSETCVTILGFIVFTWIEEKLRLGIRRMFTDAKSN